MEKSEKNVAIMDKIANQPEKSAEQTVLDMLVSMSPRERAMLVKTAKKSVLKTVTAKPITSCGLSLNRVFDLPNDPSKSQLGMVAEVRRLAGIAVENPVPVDIPAFTTLEHIARISAQRPPETKAIAIAALRSIVSDNISAAFVASHKGEKTWAVSSVISALVGTVATESSKTRQEKKSEATLQAICKLLGG